MINRTMLLAAIVASGFTAVPVFGQQTTHYPFIYRIDPVAAQVGTTSTHQVVVHYRQRLADAFGVIVSGKGVVGEIVHTPVKPGTRSLPRQIRITVKPDAETGVRDIRVVTPQGASTVGQLVIVRDPVVAETDDFARNNNSSTNNDSIESAQEFTVPAVLAGSIAKPQDVDFYRFKATAGTSLVFHVRSKRLQDRIHMMRTRYQSNLILTLRDKTGSTLAVSDNYFSSDPCLGYRFRRTGEYTLEIRDIRYESDTSWPYCIEVHSRPLVSRVFPLGVRAGESTRLELFGFNLPEQPTATLQLDPKMKAGLHQVRLPLGKQTIDPILVVVSDVPVIQESNKDNDSPERAQLVSIPVGINGRIDRAGDSDYFTFEAQQGERLTFEVFARRCQSDIDSELRLERNGPQADDTRLGVVETADARLEHWTPKTSGKQVIRLRDLQQSGGPESVYFLKIKRSEPYFELYLNTDKTQLTPGTSSVIFAKIIRKNGFDGEVQLHLDPDSLPQGVTASCGRILTGSAGRHKNGWGTFSTEEDGCIVLHAAPDAKMSAANITVNGTAEYKTADGKTKTLHVEAIPYQEIALGGSGRGYWPVSMHTVAIGRPNDIRAVKIESSQLNLEPGESKRIEVTIERAPGFTANVSIDLRYRHSNGTIYSDPLPQGVSIDEKNSKLMLFKEDVKGYITVKAAADAPPISHQQVAVMAQAPMRRTHTWKTFCAPPLWVKVLDADSAERPVRPKTTK